jgi:hypothetical protein
MTKDEAFEKWYVENAFDYVADPIGSRDCNLQRKAWKAAKADEIAQLQLDITEVTKARDFWQDWAGKNVIENDAEILKLQLDIAKLREALIYHTQQTRPIYQTEQALATTSH